MGKEYLIDVDGVVVRPRHKYFSQKLSEEHNIPMDEVLPFFKGDYKRAAIGEVDIREVLPPYLQKWNWQGTVDEFLNYWFESEKDLDQKVLEIVKELRESGNKVHLASDNEANRAKYLMEELGLKDIFDSAFFSADLGVTKSDPEFFKKIAEKLGVNITELNYWDDDQKNVDVASALGVTTHLYTTPENFEIDSKR